MDTNNHDMDRVWKEYSRTKDPALKEQIILHYAHIVKYVAGRLSTHIGQHVEYEDMISYGILGLIDAIDKFDHEKGVKFETYSSLRIRGAIIDNLRKLDWVPRTLRQKNKQLEQAYSDLEAQLGREPSEDEIAENLGIKVDEVHEMIKKSSIASLISLDDYLDQHYEGNQGLSSGSNSMQSSSDLPEASYDAKEAKQMLAEAIDKLSDKEKKVVALYYFEELTLKEISVVMGVSESRISQIHSKAILKMRTKLGKYRSILMM